MRAELCGQDTGWRERQWVSLTPEQIREDLEGELRGEVLTDAVSRALYSTDASIFQVLPVAVIAPADEEDVRKVVRYARQNRLPIAARGAGSGMAGESLTTGIVLDFSKHFRGITEQGSDRVRVQPGVVYQQLQEVLARQGRRLAVDIASGAQCTIGGMLANNASGARAIRYGYMRDQVLGLRCVWDDGSIEECGRAEPYPALSPHQTPQPDLPSEKANQTDGEANRPEGETKPSAGDAAPGETATHASRKAEVLRGLVPLLQEHRDLFPACKPRTAFNRCGYALEKALTPEGVDLAGLIVGSEGTLALITEADLRTVPIPVERALVLTAFASLESAARSAAAALSFAPSACELVDRRLLSLTLEARPAYRKLVPADSEAVLLVEFESEQPGAERQARDWQLFTRNLPGVLASHLASGAAEVEWFWQLRQTALPLLQALPGPEQPTPYVEDVGVPVECLPEFLVRIQELLQQEQWTAALLIHAGAGIVHTRPFVDWRQPGAFDRLRHLADALYEWVWRLGGTISAQHAVGLARSPWVKQQFGRLADLFRLVKEQFDPQRIFNPGKLVEVDESLARSLRRDHRPRIRSMALPQVGSEPASRQSSNGEEPYRLSWALRWPGDSLPETIHQCNGCAACRTESSSNRMCPLFRVLHEESATPRAKANLFRSLLDGTLPPEMISSDAVRQVADLCINCKMCALECPASVNIPKLMLEIKAQHVAEHGLRADQWLLSRLEGFVRWLGRFAWMVNTGLNTRVVRWLLWRFFGLARQRRLPKLARVPFLEIARRRGWTRWPTSPARQERVALFVDFYGNYVDTTLPLSAVLVLQLAGIDVFVPPGQVNCGMAALACGDVENARRLARTNLQIFADLARAGLAIVCCEPTSAVMFRVDHANLLDDPDVELVARQTQELAAYVWQLHQQGRLPLRSLQPLPLNVGHHVPCHVKALTGGGANSLAGPYLLRLIPQLQVETLDVSCSGMAGPFGMSERHYADSLRAGRPMLERLAREAIHCGSSECSACRLQMEDVTAKPSLHPVQYLAMALGLLPELRQRLRHRRGMP